MMKTSNVRGFTIIELLVVMSIIGLLSSIIFSSIHVAKVRAQDKARIAQAKEVKKAIMLFYEDRGTIPSNYICSSGSCSVNTDPNETEAAQEGTDAFNASMQELVDGGYLPQIPVSPDGTSFYYYGNFSATVPVAVFGSGLGGTFDSDPTSSQCAWSDYTNFDQTVLMAGSMTPYFTTDIYYFINVVTCYESKIQLTPGPMSVPDSECSTAAANPANAGKCFVRKSQYLYHGYQIIDYYSSYSAASCLGPVVQTLMNNPPVTLASFGLTQADLVSHCTSSSEYCTCFVPS